jgi:hypothetical protein
MCWITCHKLSEVQEQATNNIEIVLDIDELRRQTDWVHTTSVDYINRTQ